MTKSVISEAVRKSPIPHRSFVLRAIAATAFLGAVLNSIASTASGEPDSKANPRFADATLRQLTEADVIRLARVHAPNALVARAEANSATAAERGAGLYPNPTIEWAREAIPGDVIEAETEDVFALTIPIDLSGARGAERALARSEAESLRSGAARRETDAVSDALDRYYAAIAAQQRVEIIEKSLARLEEAARIIASLEAEGRVAGYEDAWVRVETDLAQGELAEAQADATATRFELASLIGRDANTLRFPAVIEAGAVQPSAKRHEREAIRRAEASVVEAKEARDSAGTAWIPRISATGGAKQKTSDETRWGYVVGVELDIPIFSNGQGLRAEAEARTHLAEAELAAERKATRTAIARAKDYLERTTSVLERFDAETSVQVERLLRAVESGYREGHRSIVELAEAQEVYTRAEERRLELALTRKRAEIALRAAMGEFE